MSNNAKKPLVLVVIDGFGFVAAGRGNATFHAAMPTWNKLTMRVPWILLQASGTHVGLLPGYIGNSEVGHLTIGAGRVVESMLKKFHDAIADQSFFAHPVLLERFAALKASGQTLHLMGVVSDGGVHGHIEHLFGLLKLAQQVGLEKVLIHAFLDGRDVAPQSAAEYLARVEEKCKEYGRGKIASIHGRFYAMDRDKNWERTQVSYDVLCGNSPDMPEQTWRQALEKSYAGGVFDEFVVPTRLIPGAYIAAGDGMVIYNFRPDRSRQLTETFINPHFEPFMQRQNLVVGQGLACMVTGTLYDHHFTEWHNNDVIFEREEIAQTLVDEIAAQSNGQMTVLMVAETEKYAHVTYFFRGMVDKQLPSETRMIVASQKVRNYIKNPEMSALQITKHVIEALEENATDVYVINYANADMVGHAGNFQATVAACDIIDKQLEQLYGEVVEKLGGTLIVTADHGNAEEQVYEATGLPHTAHTTHPVPFIILTKDNKNYFKAALADYLIHTAWKDACTQQCPVNQSLGLSNIAPTILTYLGFTVPSVMNKESLI